MKREITALIIHHSLINLGINLGEKNYVWKWKNSLVVGGNDRWNRRVDNSRSFLLWLIRWCRLCFVAIDNCQFAISRGWNSALIAIIQK
jgi:hypothetical protein